MANKGRWQRHVSECVSSGLKYAQNNFILHTTFKSWTKNVILSVMNRKIADAQSLRVQIDDKAFHTAFLLGSFCDTVLVARTIAVWKMSLQSAPLISNVERCWLRALYAAESASALRHKLRVLSKAMAAWSKSTSV
jgi:hypothetical protein